MTLLENFKTLFLGTSRLRSGDSMELLKSIQETKLELDRIEHSFKEVTDDDLLDYYMYCRLAAVQKYNYLIKQYKLCANVTYEIPGSTGLPMEQTQA